MYLLFLLTVTNVNSQDALIAKTSRDLRGYGISNEFHSEPGFAGSYWHTSMRILYAGNEQYLLTIYKPASDGYYRIYEDEDCYIKLDNNEIVTLKLNTELSPWNYVFSGYYSGKIWMATRYFTQAFYNIPDISVFLNHKITKVRWFLNSKPYDIDYEENKWVKKISKRFVDAIKEAASRYVDASTVVEDKLDGF